ncbi:hypothetical protein AXF42_Ash008581 [Apostasia shenzhenica]|uniref:Uncharacterized protein n=1 Tax=Apostasia shenzhenica TaxID=1088818 RepID=A0A2I0B1S4_9ASPA|nr:hypothetical protein AXF42_Ash008581 [Apostasia shenzhenica]
MISCSTIYLIPYLVSVESDMKDQILIPVGIDVSISRTWMISNNGNIGTAEEGLWAQDQEERSELNCLLCYWSFNVQSFQLPEELLGQKCKHFIIVISN